MELHERRQLTGGFGDALSRAFELAFIPVLFGWFGHLIDGRAGTSPTFMAILGLFGIVGTLLKMWFRYVAEMREQEEGAPWHRP